MATHTIGVTNQKGGVGKTTTAINLAAGLALAGHRTLFIDLDPQGNGTSGLGVAREQIIHTAHEVLMGEIPLDQAVMPTPTVNLALVASDMRLIAAEKELLSADDRHTRLSSALAHFGNAYHYVIVDTPPSLGLLTLNVFCGVQHLIIPVQSEYYALEGLSMLVETTRSIQESLNPGLQILGLVLTMVDGRTNLARQVVEEVVRHFGDKVFKTVIARSVRLSEAPSHGQPIMTYDPRSHATRAYEALTEEVIARCELASSKEPDHDADNAAMSELSSSEVEL